MREVYSAVAPLVRRRLFRWYARHGRALPWRETRDPYRILVSEVMLQQTQVSRVIPTYGSFLARFASLDRLAAAPLGEVLRAWAGLGYNRRARDLHRAAQACPDGLPSERAALDALPGIGAYTAGAVACFSHDAPEAFADTNIARVLGRVLLGRDPGPRHGEQLDRALLSRRAPARWHHALMDLGATVCLARAPRCERCPLAGVCVARARGIVAMPARRPQAAFAGSDRRVRGRIVALLRDGPDGLTVAELRARTGDGRVARLVAALAAEGLVARRGRRVTLPS